MAGRHQEYSNPLMVWNWTWDDAKLHGPKRTIGGVRFQLKCDGGKRKQLSVLPGRGWDFGRNTILVSTADTPRQDSSDDFVAAEDGERVPSRRSSCYDHGRRID